MTLVTAPRSQLLEDLPRWLRELHISHVGIVPSLIEATMLAVEESGGPVDDGDDAIHLSFIASGGEKMSDSVSRQAILSIEKNSQKAAILTLWSDPTKVG